jgi:hypothetical protein
VGLGDAWHLELDPAQATVAAVIYRSNGPMKTLTAETQRFAIRVWNQSTAIDVVSSAPSQFSLRLRVMILMFFSVERRGTL